MNWTIEDLKNKGFKPDLTGVWHKVDKVSDSKPKRAKSIPKGLLFIMETLYREKIQFEKEYKFHPTRKFKIDIYAPQFKLGIEYEGLMSRKSRHTTVTGYTNDASKYNLMQEMGITVYRYTALNYLNFEADLKRLL